MNPKYIAAECPIHGLVFCPASETAQTPARSTMPYATLPAAAPSLCGRTKVKKLSFEQSLIPPRFANKNFENYSVSGSCQQAVFETCKEFADKIIENIQNGRGLLLIGTPGTGKNSPRMLNSLRGDLARQNRTFTTVGKMLSKIKTAWVARSCG